MSKRFIIEGSRASDGVYYLGIDHLAYEADPLRGQVPLSTPPMSVSGQSWVIRFEWYGGGALGWKSDTFLKRSSVAYTIQEGLVVDLLSDNSIFRVPAPGIDVYDSASLRCHNVDPKLNPNPNFKNPYDFTLPPRERPIEPD